MCYIMKVAAAGHKFGARVISQSMDLHIIMVIKIQFLLEKVKILFLDEQLLHDFNIGM